MQYSKYKESYAITETRIVAQVVKSINILVYIDFLFENYIKQRIKKKDLGVTTQNARGIWFLELRLTLLQKPPISYKPNAFSWMSSEVVSFHSHEHTAHITPGLRKGNLASYFVQNVGSNIRSVLGCIKVCSSMKHFRPSMDVPHESLVRIRKYEMIDLHSELIQLFSSSWSFVFFLIFLEWHQLVKYWMCQN